MLKKVRGPFGFQKLVTDPDYPSMCRFSDPAASNPRQLVFAPGRYFLLISNTMENMSVQVKDGSSPWVEYPVTGSASWHCITIKENGLVMVKKSKSDRGDAHMVIINPPPPRSRKLCRRIREVVATWR